MHQHALSRELTEQQRETVNPSPPEPSFFRGVFFAILFSIPLWGLIIWAAYELFR